MHTVTWRLFADLAEAAGGREHTVSVDADGTVGDALDALLGGNDALTERVRDGEGIAEEINLMRNGSPASLEADVADGDELAMFPPVTGG
ncbi:ubiquitin-like small modifier protein 1 [Halobellus sp. GM3]|uniref:ubiquitin-like small modifier protein 1 n=1 Tax=Halobellus sp. GM3 TaxID=3458410 RepID=UPI00403D57C5